MGKVFESIDTDIQSWISRQAMFFVATAPSSDEGCVNLSPKGHDTLRVLDSKTLAFIDYGGSGIETVAHLRENGRIVIMMCAFNGPAKIFRFHGRGSVITPGEKDFDTLVKQFDTRVLGVRAIIRVSVTRISDSCGFGVPLMDFKAQRDISPNYIRTRGIPATRDYMEANNQQSIDGLSALSPDEAQRYYPPDVLAEKDA